MTRKPKPSEIEEIESLTNRSTNVYHNGAIGVRFEGELPGSVIDILCTRGYILDHVTEYDNDHGVYFEAWFKTE